MPTISVCIATHERANLLLATLEALALQDRLPDEVVISDSSRSLENQRIMDPAFVQHSRLPVTILRAECSALPWLRRHAAARATGDVILFLDDDVRLHPAALRTLDQAYSALSSEPGGMPAGVGFAMTWDDGSRPSRERGSLRERWLGTAGRPSGCLTPGGLSVSLADVPDGRATRVDHLWGGAMSFRREVLERVGVLDRLIDLYRDGIGRGEDVVLSRYAAKWGPLYLLPQPLAWHRRETPAEPTPYAPDGWRLSMTATWGRAHTLRWVATNLAAYRGDWARLVTLELARSGLAIARRPWHSEGWARLAGASIGIARALLYWRRIPPSARSARAE